MAVKNGGNTCNQPIGKKTQKPNDNERSVFRFCAASMMTMMMNDDTVNVDGDVDDDDDDEEEDGW